MKEENIEEKKILKQVENRLKRIEQKIYGMPLCDNCLEKKQKYQIGVTTLGNIAGFCSRRCENETRYGWQQTQKAQQFRYEKDVVEEIPQFKGTKEQLDKLTSNQ